MASRRASFLIVCAVSVGSPGCREKRSEPSRASVPSAAAPAAPKFDALDRSAFNRRAVELNQPFFWRADENGNRALDPNELVVIWPHQFERESNPIGPGGHFTARFSEIYAEMKTPVERTDLDEKEKARRSAVRLELSQGRPTLIESDFTSATPADKALVRHLLEVARLIEQIYARQKGVSGLESTRVPAEDPASRALFFRNQGPECTAPKTEKDPDCGAIPGLQKLPFGLYPAELQARPAFCRELEKQRNAAELLDHFTIVVPGRAPNPFEAVPYSLAYAEWMRPIAGELSAAAAALGPEEAALRAYLLAAAQAFRDNDWEGANRAWVAMSAENSKYYLRVAPDEVYFEPCAWKAGFALSFATINKESLELRAKLEPVKQELENELAELAGPPYAARPVHFQLPDFIDVVLNAGDSRAPLGATSGQSLPNWGEVAERGGRTVVMTNLGKDPDSKRARRDTMSALLCPATLQKVPLDAKESVLGTVLHEMAHNLGPSHDYRVRGKVASAVFGGPLAAMLEELKAQTAALYLPDRLAAKQLIPREELERGPVEELVWALGQISQGMYDGAGSPKTYPQLASIQLGSLLEAGALEWKADARAGNATDTGCFELHGERWRSAVSRLMKHVLMIQSRGDRGAAAQLVARFIDAEGPWKELRGVVTERALRGPRASYVYSIKGL